MRCYKKNCEISTSALPLLTVFQHFQREPEENNGMNQCIDTVTPEHLEDRGRNTEKLKKGRSVWANANTHMCLCGPPSPRKKKQQFLTVTYNFHCVLAIKSSLLHTHTAGQVAGSPSKMKDFLIRAR